MAHGVAQLRATPGHRFTPKRTRFTGHLIEDSTVNRSFIILAEAYAPTRLATTTRSKRTAGVKVPARCSIRAHAPASFYRGLRAGLGDGRVETLGEGAGAGPRSTFR